MNPINRRGVLRAGGLTAAAGLALSAGAPTGAAQAAASPGARTRSFGEETKTLDELYQDALTEGGGLVIYAGGDTSSQQDAVKSAFQTRFPGIDLKMIVDYSKFHDVRVDNQLATNTLVPDIVQLQTLHDFDRWKNQGILMPYKPAGYSAVHTAFRDPGCTWIAVQVIAFSFLYNVAGAGAQAPSTPADLIDPQWAGKIASSYPHDDDAVLYLFSLYQEAYGWNWMSQFAAQQPQFARGTHTPGAAVTAGQKVIGVGAAGTLTAPPTAPNRWVVANGHPFVAWGQRAAILNGAAHPAAAKLYMNWRLSPEHQATAFNGWSVRTDVTPPGNLPPVWTYTNANVPGFASFMADRAAAERWRQTFALYFGEVSGPPSPGWLGLHPGQ
jgi:ABC-type Fe3+ transport system substrate-binding protein